jgi:hypothetical protein
MIEIRIGCLPEVACPPLENIDNVEMSSPSAVCGSTMSAYDIHMANPR